MALPKDKQLWLEGIKSVHQNTAAEHLEIEVTDISDDRVELKMPITDKARQPMGLLHGGVSMVIAETAASLHACWGIDLSEQVPVGIEINGSHLRSAEEGVVVGVGKVVRRSRKLIVHQVDLYHEATGDHLCTARVTNYYKSVQDKTA